MGDVHTVSLAQLMVVIWVPIIIVACVLWLGLHRR